MLHALKTPLALYTANSMLVTKAENLASYVANGNLPDAQSS